MKLRLFFWGSLLAIGSATSSCAIAVLGAGAYVGSKAYNEGVRKEVVNMSFAKTLLATRRAVEALQFRPRTEWNDAIDANITVVRGNGSEVQIDLKKIDCEQTEISIRVSVFGDEEIAEIVFNEIICQAEEITDEELEENCFDY